MEAELEGRPYHFILDKPLYRWECWAAPKTADGKLNHNRAIIGDDLKDFVDYPLFPYLRGFKQKASGPFQGADVKTVVLFFEKGAPTLRPSASSGGSGQARKI